jgi:hypothetical protein
LADTLRDLVKKKINEYNLGLLTQYPTEDKGYCFVTYGMIIFVDEVDNSVSVTFQADQKPEVAASNIMILNEIDEIEDIFIMESFIYDSKNNYISGDDAHELVKSSIITQAFQKVAKQQIYNEILTTSKCFDC